MQNLDKKKKEWNILPIHQRITFSFSFFLRGNIKTKKNDLYSILLKQVFQSNSFASEFTSVDI